jgi:amino acid transporter
MLIANHGLKRELKLRDLVLMQILLVVGLEFTGYAAKQGPSQVVLWLLAMALFYLPLAAVAMKLSRAIPVEGGVYQWVKTGISPFAGYMAGWCFAIWVIAYFASAGSQLANGVAYASGSYGSSIATSKIFTLSITFVMCFIAFVLNVRGLHAAKGLSGAGSVLKIITAMILLYLLVLIWIGARSSSHIPFSFVWPGFSILTLNVFTKMALFALSGLEGCSIFAEECHKPTKHVARSVWIAVPLIALMYILATGAILGYIAPGDVDVATPIPQVMEVGFGNSSIGHTLAAIAVVAPSLGLMATVVIVVGMVARLPMVAGWDGILPAWWSELHARFKTPYKAIGAVALGLFCMGALSLLGAENQEAVQVLSAVGFGSYCLMYLLLLGMVAAGFRSSVFRPGVLMRAGALAGFLVVLISLGFQLLPVGEVADPALFAVKVGLAICAANGLGAYLYWRGAKSRNGGPRQLVSSADV